MRLESLGRGSLAPLGVPVFRRLWSASVASHFGAMIQTVAAAWMMAALTGDPQMVALVQTCATLPMMLISVPAGALADIYDRRNIMLVAQCAMLGVAAGLTALTAAGLANPAILLAATFLIASGVALHGPAWQASLQDQVSRDLLEPAASLNSVGLNVARSIGPATGGLVIAAWGVAAAFAVNALSFVGLILALLGWKRTPQERLLPPETISGAVRSGLRYLVHSPQLVAVLARGATFGFCGSAVWALTAVLARDSLDTGPAGFGFLLGGFGFGAVVGAFARNSVTIPRELLVRRCSVAFGLCAIVLGVVTNLAAAILLMAAAGAAWVMTLTGLGVTVQIIAPRWVVGRAVALNQVSVFAGMAAGSTLWGFVAGHWDIRTAFIASGVGMLASIGLALPFPIRAEDVPDLTPARMTPIDELQGPVDPNDGPIVITVAYRVRPENFAAFLETMNEVGRMRRRNGAFGWTILQSVDDPTQWIERFHSPTWIDHLRRQTRPTRADQAVRARLDRLHEGGIIVSRLIERRAAPPGMAPHAMADAASGL